MDTITRLDSISEFSSRHNNACQHPLINVLDLSLSGTQEYRRTLYGFYAIYLKDVKCGDLRYGCNYYDYEAGTLVFIAPGQLMGVEPNGDTYQPSGSALVFHPDLISSTSLGKRMSDYAFFSYSAREALHLSEEERATVLCCLQNIRKELDQGIDKHSKTLIASNIELFLNYCRRFYDRQFLTREHVNKGILERFDQLLNDYFASDTPGRLGLPTVNWCAEELNLSTNYFGDLIRKEAGITAQEFIQTRIIDIARLRIFDKDKTIAEIAYELGFKYPQHFTRTFKQHVGYSPLAYRSIMN